MVSQKKRNGFKERYLRCHYTAWLRDWTSLRSMHTPCDEPQAVPARRNERQRCVNKLENMWVMADDDGE